MYVGSFCWLFFLSREWRCHEPAFCALDYNFRRLCFSQLAGVLYWSKSHKNIAHYNYVMACLGPCRHRTVHLIIIIHAHRREKTENVYSHDYYDDHEKILWMKIISIPQFYLVWCVAVQFWRCQSSHQKDHHSYKYLQVHTKNIFGIT